MRLRELLIAGSLSFAPITLLGMPSVPAADTPGFASPGTVAQFEVQEKTQVPGQLLKAGSYSITVLDHLSDRMVLRVAGSDGKEQATFLALPGGSRIARKPSQGPIVMNPAKGKTALRGFVFADGSVAEFVYPKDEAVSLAKSNSITVPAIDPASEGRSASPSLSHTDMELVTLWMLTPTVVGSTQGIEAKRYQPEVATASAPPPPPAPVNSGRVRPAGPAASAPVASAPAAPTPAPVKPKAVAHPIAALPHTASDAPLFALVGLCCLSGALLLGIRRMRPMGR